MYIVHKVRRIIQSNCMPCDEPSNKSLNIQKVFVGQAVPGNEAVEKSLIDDLINALDGFEPGVVTNSTKWKNWIAQLDLFTCKYCRKMHGKIFDSLEVVEPEPPVHDKCRCEIKGLLAVFAGYATKEGFQGADYWLMKYKKLPEYYLTKQEAKERGWIPIQGNLSEVAPGMMIGGDIYQNRSGHLPAAEGRIWYEADINYILGFRARHRILYSNDGLIFVSYDHYETFVEIV